ncbi:glycoside hydrolase family 47 protein [Laccaria bicolor S238N-H82]|uniref:mannosyl-oligosaccharide 1,2-alpha-mannosidase n=1 Tax=Laccaria bicolor (strain S238N-H82 / ATCC MYA-4686) TaxID=486041 RepID=B0CNM9_LACBS|nr:glycoside hydrolase family 47 protein [Laccaria bicolor S238N-H82]EDR15960.1 glycoside hydrolase family 47 protein [Laccaria bicolor S238N-H82]|eukprot:XP_001874168.1 glycoside hydrolase family 47 protein [Laccaria bicolor S238N-H82]
MRTIKDAWLPHGLASIFLKLLTKGSMNHQPSDLVPCQTYVLQQKAIPSNVVYRDMYDDAMTAIHSYLIQESKNAKMTHMSELIPKHHKDGEISWRLTPKQDHLVCFLGGSLMLGATHTGTVTQQPVSIPPRLEELVENGQRDWKTGVELIKTCMNTHDTASGLSPEIVYFRVPSDGMDGYNIAPSDWYIHGAQKGEFPPYDTCLVIVMGLATHAGYG